MRVPLSEKKSFWKNKTDPFSHVKNFLSTLTLEVICDKSVGPKERGWVQPLFAKQIIVLNSSISISFEKE